MQKKTSLLFLILSLSILLSACSSGVRTVSVGENSNGQTIQLKTGEILQVALKSDPINGYTWQVERIDPAYLEYEPKDQYTPEGQDPVTGGTQVLQFKALQSGSTQLGLTYKKSSGEGVSLPKNFQIHVVIQ